MSPKTKYKSVQREQFMSTLSGFIMYATSQIYCQDW